MRCWRKRRNDVCRSSFSLVLGLGKDGSVVGWFQSTTNFVLAVRRSLATVDREDCLEESGIALVARRRNEPEEDAARAMWKSECTDMMNEGKNTDGGERILGVCCYTQPFLQTCR